MTGTLIRHAEISNHWNDDGVEILTVKCHYCEWLIKGPCSVIGGLTRREAIRETAAHVRRSHPDKKSAGSA